jgi:hypothetical protein
MSRRFQFSLATVLLIVTCCALALGLLVSSTWHWWELSELQRENEELRVARNLPPRRGPPDAVIRDWPMTIAMSEWGNFAHGYSWNLSVNSAGEAQLTIHTWPNDSVVKLHVPDERLAELRRELIQERFFGLAESYGEIAADGSTQTITIALGEFTKTVRLHYLMNWANRDPAKLRNPARAVRVGMLIRNWFKHPDAVDTRDDDQKVLDAVYSRNDSANEK